MKEANKRARIIIFEGVLWQMVEKGGGSRRDLFSPVGKPSDYTPTENAGIKEEIGKKEWQNAVLKRLMDNKLLTSRGTGDQLYYETVDRGRTRSLADAAEEMTPEFLWYVFPGDAPEGAPDAEHVMDPTPVEEPMSEDIAEEVVDVEDADPEDPPKRSRAVLNGTAFLSAIEKIASGFNTSNDHLKRVSTLLVELTGGLAQIPDAVINALRPSQQITNKRLIDIDGRLKDLHLLLESNHKLMKDHLSNVEEIKSATAVLTQSSVEFYNRTSMITALQQALEVFISEYKAERKDRVAELMKRLSAHIKESDALREMMLEVVSDGEERKRSEAPVGAVPRK